MPWKRDERNRFTNAQHAKMVKMFKDGKSLSEVAESAGCAPQSVSVVLKKAGAMPVSTPDPPKKRSKAKRLQVALAALKPLMEAEGLEEVVVSRDLETGEVVAELRKAPPAPILVKVG